MNKKIILVILFIFIAIAVFSNGRNATPEYMEGKWLSEDGEEIWIWEKVNEYDGILTIINKETGKEEYYGWKFIRRVSGFSIQFSYNKWTNYYAVKKDDGTIAIASVHDANLSYILKRIKDE